LRLHRRTDAERDQDGDGDEPGGVRHAGLLAQEDVMSDPILLLAGSRFNAEALTFQQIGTSLAQTGQI
jgi:hypothetical protein